MLIKSRSWRWGRAGLVPAIDVLLRGFKDVDARDRFTLGPAEGRTRVRGHDVSSRAL